MRAFYPLIWLILSVSGVAAGKPEPVPPAPASPAAPPPQAAWCAEELETLPSEVCYFAPASEHKPTALVIFLHGVVKPDTTWQWTQQHALIRYARAHGFAVIMPRARRGYGRKEMKDWWAWPTSAAAQQAVEAEVLAEWMTAKKLLEERYGRPFEQTYVFGFSSGAYYASSLALRGRLEIDGYAIFAGGSAPKHLRSPAQRPRVRPPIYVGYGTKDRARKDPQALAKALRALGWKHRVEARRVGHTMTDSQVKNAIAFFRNTHNTLKTPDVPKPAQPRQNRLRLRGRS